MLTLIWYIIAVGLYAVCFGLVGMLVFMTLASIFRLPGWSRGKK